MTSQTDPMILKWIMRSKPPDEKLTDRRPGEDSGLPADVQRGGSLQRLDTPIKALVGSC